MALRQIEKDKSHADGQVAALVPICGSYGRPVANLHGAGFAEQLFVAMRRSGPRT